MEAIPERCTDPALEPWAVELRVITSAARFHAGEVSVQRALGELLCLVRDLLHLDWCIVGGESGSGARDNGFEANARQLLDQCRGFVPFFGKQNVRKAPLPADLMVREWPE